MSIAFPRSNDPAHWRAVLHGPDVPRWQPAPDPRDVIACVVAEEIGRIRARHAVASAIDAIQARGGAIGREAVCDLAAFVLSVDGRTAPRALLRRFAAATLRRKYGQHVGGRE